MLILEIGNIETNIVGDINTPKFHSEFISLRQKMSFRPQSYMFSKKFKQHHWDGWKRLAWKNTKRCFFPTGLLSIAREHFKERGVEYKIVDARFKPESNIQLEYNYDDYMPRDYQQRAIDVSVDKNRGIIWAATASGKTLIAAGIIHKCSVSPFLFLVTSIDLLEQTTERMSEMLMQNGVPLKVGQIGAGKVDIRDINIMTVQTAVRALGKKFVKFDNESKDDKLDKTLLQKFKKEIVQLIHDSKGVICDECQHWRADMCQIVTHSLVNAYYRYGISGTPYRDEGDDLLIQSCFGKIICEIPASELIVKGFLVKPYIHFIHINPKPSKFKNWQNIYKEQIVENEYYNTLIANIAEEYIANDRLVLVLIQQIEHGKTLENMIGGSEFVHGNSPKKERITALKRLHNRHIRCIISSSLPYEELLLVKHKGMIKQFEIGDLCTNFEQQVKNGEFEACCSLDGKVCSWEKITLTHIHNRQNKIVRVQTNRYEDILVTENHSLVTSELSPVLPELDEKACVPINIPPLTEPIKEINIAELLKDIKDPSIEVEVLGLTHPIIRRMKSIYRYYVNKKSVCKTTRCVVKKQTKDKDKDYFVAVYQIIENFKYYKYRYRAKLSDVWWCKELFKNFECRIYIRRSRKKFSLPITLQVTEDLAIISGLMCGDGHIKNHTRGKTCKSIYSFCFAGLKDMSNSHEGNSDPDKKAVREIYKNHFHKVFGNVKLRETDHLLVFRSKLMYYLFKELGHIDKVGEKRVPDYVYNSSKEVQENFIWGLYLSDGSKRLDYHLCTGVDINKFTGICIHNTSRKLVAGVCNVLKLLNKRYYSYYSITKNRPNDKPHYLITIVDNILKLHPFRQRNKINFNCSDRIQKKVEITPRNDEFVYDISVERCHNFVSGMGGILAHNSIFDEGVDCRPLDTLVLAGGGKSSTRAMQRIGRTLRTFEGKESATIIDFFIHEKYLENHAKAREKMYKTEEEFVIEHNFLD